MADPFRVLTSRTVVLPQADIDTDQIIPARFLTTTTREGLGHHAFHDWRAAGSTVLDADPAEHRILVAGRNFGCGSSREHAPWALYDFGFRAVIAPSIADIFRANALETGLLPVAVEEAVFDRLAASPGAEATLDLEACELRFDGETTRFSIDPFARRRLLDGADTLSWLLRRLPEIEAFERRRAA
ncbi:MAG TPA: 3-isopropylmalate dehydratase small subunit [Caulobacteraceae bacterium]|jgi:3-isopropylmalate/(R)-2-methylmalate dehydratase small subunit